MIDPVALAAALIRRPSITPQDAGVLGVLEDALKPLGFECHRLKFEAKGTAAVENLFAKIPSPARLPTAGSTGAVPPT
jgi:succinyl-diaminopimelate desuccinylase